MTKLEIDAQLDNCCGPVPKPYVRPKLTGIEREKLERLDEIGVEYHKEFGGNK